MAKIISIGNQKGGCGKTTTSVNLAAGLALLGKTVLLVDMDPQGNASLTFGINIEDIHISIADILLDNDIEFKYNIFKKGPIHIAPSNPTLNLAEERLYSMTDRFKRLSFRLEEVRDRYDYIIIDCPPSIGVLTTNALMASDGVIIPVDVGFYALVGVRQFLAKIEDVKEVNPKLELMGVVVTRYNERNVISREVLGKVKDAFGDKLFKTPIRHDVKLIEAPGHLKSVFEHSWRGRGAEDYLNFAKEVSKCKR
ncbi:MAG: ParA family protein [Deltaproteobacteria bacterium]|nr:ParA family protein [Deltaproteobacteria bacterium]